MRRLLRKLADDQVLDLTQLLAWGVLSTVLALLLGLLALAGLVLGAPERVAALEATALRFFPGSTAGLIGDALDDARDSAGLLGGAGLGLLLWTGTGFFDRLQGVFNRIDGAPDRSLPHRRALGLVAMAATAGLLAVATVLHVLAAVLAGAAYVLFELVPWVTPSQALLGSWAASAVSIVAAGATFLLFYHLLPNVVRPWRRALPGTVVATVLFFASLQLFPLYVGLAGRAARPSTVFGGFVLLMVWSYLLGLILVLGAEVNSLFDAPRSHASHETPKSRAS